MNAGGVVELVDGLIRQAISVGASDVHFDPDDSGLRVRFRVDAMLQEKETLPPAIAPNVVARLKVLAGLLTYRADIPQEGAITPEAGYGVDIRVATLPTLGGERVVLRLLGVAQRFLTLDDLGFSPALAQSLKRLLAAPQGLLIVCGPAGSGKTTTLYAMLDHILKSRQGVSVLSIEDPVEIRLPGVTQVKLEPHRALTYPVVLRSALRQDPQILMIGEIRDADVANIAVEASLTGHLLLTTMHSGTPAQAIVRLREMGIPAYQLTSVLLGVLAQRLVRKRSASGGYQGRNALSHLVEVSAGLRAAILADADVDALAAHTSASGSLNADAERLLAAGVTDELEISRVLGTNRPQNNHQ